MKGLNILLAEDDEVNQFITVAALRKWACLRKQEIHTSVARNGREAIELILSEDFDLVLMDLQMPEMDGLEATHRIRCLGGNYFKRVPIIAFSASSLVDTREKARLLGLTDMINKPFQFEEFQEIVNTYIMNTGYQPFEESRPLHIDFDLYTDGDEDFKPELTLLLIENIHELKQSFNEAISQKNPQVFLGACHKVATTISMLNDDELTQTIEVLRDHFKDKTKLDDMLFREKIVLLNKLCDSIARSLEVEAKAA